MQKQDKLDRLLDAFREWKAIYGDTVSAGYVEPADRGRDRKKFEQEIASLRDEKEKNENRRK